MESTRKVRASRIRDDYIHNNETKCCIRASLSGIASMAAGHRSERFSLVSKSTNPYGKSHRAVSGAAKIYDARFKGCRVECGLKLSRGIFPAHTSSHARATIDVNHVEGQHTLQGSGFKNVFVNVFDCFLKIVFCVSFKNNFVKCAAD